ncbi:hypothetical protein V1517DRAFT_354199 [Lipomyces orientalis]|uniref:Uncharacterized protein n=1 Tax=Lipomyces orientalis TaxID=1233043 RepID=A0ACC3TL49_9ASCO
MVGVPGGSRGCANCKKRKIKICNARWYSLFRGRCDETFPKCRRYVKPNLDCGRPTVSTVFRKQRLGRSVGAEHLTTNLVGTRLRNLLMTDDERRIHGEEVEIRSRTLPGLLFEQLIQKQLRATWVEVILQFVLSSVPSSTTFASKSLVISHCDPDIALLASNWYVQASRHQKELVNIVTSDYGRSLRIYPATDNKGAAEQDSMLPSSLPAVFSISLIPSKDSILLPEHSSTPLDLPVLTAGRDVSSMRGNFMSHENDSITAMRMRMMAVQAWLTQKDTVTWQYSSSEKPIQQFMLDLIPEVPEHQEIINRFLKGSAAANDELVDLEARFEKWFEEYSEGARDFTRKHLHFPPTVEYDLLTGAPIIPTPRCPATINDQKYTATHFFGHLSIRDFA